MKQVSNLHKEDRINKKRSYQVQS